MEPSELAPFCECGCGERVRGRENGVWSRWRPGHNTRKEGWQTTLAAKQKHAPPDLTPGQLALFDPAPFDEDEA